MYCSQFWLPFSCSPWRPVANQRKDQRETPVLPARPGHKVTPDHPVLPAHKVPKGPLGLQALRPRLEPRRPTPAVFMSCGRPATKQAALPTVKRMRLSSQRGAGQPEIRPTSLRKDQQLAAAVEVQATIRSWPCALKVRNLD